MLKSKYYPAGSIADGYRTHCILKADLSGLERSLRSHTSRLGKQYWRVEFEIEVFFGQTSLCANLTWTEDVRTLSRTRSLTTHTDSSCRGRLARCDPVITSKV